jgi:hypothetical protein
VRIVGRKAEFGNEKEIGAVSEAEFVVIIDNTSICCPPDLLFGPPPLFLVLFNLFGGRMLLYRMGFDGEVVSRVFFENLCVALDILLEYLRNLGVLEDRLPRTRGLTSCAIDAFVRVNVELIRPFFVWDCQLIDAIHRTDFHTFNVFAIDAQLCDHPRH